ncbi:MAG: hypothetical protein IPG66_05180 [Hydrogenophilales bacterium]|nr:hypothetical protein [Hydrogenophilales bacterium]
MLGMPYAGIGCMVGIDGSIAIGFCIAAGFMKAAGLNKVAGLNGFMPPVVAGIIGASIIPKGVSIGASMARGLNASTPVWAWAGRAGASKAARAR